LHFLHNQIVYKLLHTAPFISKKKVTRLVALGVLFVLMLSPLAYTLNAMPLTLYVNQDGVTGAIAGMGKAQACATGILLTQ